MENKIKFSVLITILCYHTGWSLLYPNVSTQIYFGLVLTIWGAFGASVLFSYFMINNKPKRKGEGKNSTKKKPKIRGLQKVNLK